MTLRKLGLLMTVLFMAVSLPACRAIAGIFKAGVGVGIFLAVIVVGLIFFVVSKARA